MTTPEQEKEDQHLQGVGEFVTGLRQLADFYETHPQMEVPSGPSLSAVLWDAETAKDRLKVWAKTLGKADKVATDSFYGLKRKFGPITLQVSAWRDQVCEKRIVGKRTVPALEEYQVDVVEWTCDPLLTGGSDDV